MTIDLGRVFWLCQSLPDEIYSRPNCSSETWLVAALKMEVKDVFAAIHVRLEQVYLIALGSCLIDEFARALGWCHTVRVACRRDEHESM